MSFGVLRHNFCLQPILLFIVCSGLSRLWRKRLKSSSLRLLPDVMLRLLPRQHGVTVAAVFVTDIMLRLCSFYNLFHAFDCFGISWKLSKCSFCFKSFCDYVCLRRLWAGGVYRAAPQLPGSVSLPVGHRLGTRELLD